MADSEGEDGDRRYFSGVLNNARFVLELEIPLWEDPKDDYFIRLEPLWAWLFAEYGGAHVYEIGFYRTWTGANRGEDDDPDLVVRST